MRCSVSSVNVIYIEIMQTQCSGDATAEV